MMRRENKNYLLTLLFSFMYWHYASCAITCWSGTYLKNPTDSTCSNCPPGKYSVIKKDEPLTSCESCIPGKYQSSSGRSSCTSCSIGEYNDIAEAAACQKCPEGQTTYDMTESSVMPGMTFCSLCPDGQYYDESDDDKCLKCPDNKFQPLDDSYFCKDGLKRKCSTITISEQYYSALCTDTSDALITPCSQCTPGYTYASQGCISSTDTVCSECSKCSTELFLEYEFSQCNATHNTVCHPCNSSSEDMFLGTGKCNPCPAGSMKSSASSCLLCPAGKFSASSNSMDCAACPDGSISTVGATRCVKNCSSGYYSSSGDHEDVCIASPSLRTQGFRSMSVVTSSSTNMIISASAPVIYKKEGQPVVAFDSFLVATKKPYAYSSEILFINSKDDSVWSVAGNGYDSPNISDGKGYEASFAIITSITLNTHFSISEPFFYLLTEYDPSPLKTRGYLRYFSLSASESDIEGEARLLTEYSPQTLHKIANWVYPVQSVYDAWQDAFLVMDIGLNAIVQIQIQPSAARNGKHIIKSCIILLSAYPDVFNPVSIAIFHHQSIDVASLTNNFNEPKNGGLVVLDSNKILSIRGHEDALLLSTLFLTNSLPKKTLCGGGVKTLRLEMGSTLPCNEVDLSKSGAKQILLTSSTASAMEEAVLPNFISGTRDTFVVYVLLTSPSSITETAIAQITIPPNVVSDKELNISVIWIKTSENRNFKDSLVITSSTSIPLHFISNFIASSTVQSLYLVESRGIIVRLGGGTHFSSTFVPCLCDAGLYCDTGTGQCMDAPLGTYTDGPWTTDVIGCPEMNIGLYSQNGMPVKRDGVKNSCIECPIGYIPNNPMDGNQWYCQPSCAAGSFFDSTTKECLSGGCNISLGLYNDAMKGMCLPCWLGSESSGGEGLESCLPCIPGKYGKTPGKCEACPEGTTTWSFGSTLCMPQFQAVGDIQITERQKNCADGVFPEMTFSPLLLSPSLREIACPLTTETPGSVMPILLYNYSSEKENVVSLTATMDGLLFMISESSDYNLFVYDLVHHDNAVLRPWQKLTPDASSITPGTRNIFYFLQVCETCSSITSSSINDGGIKKTLYHAVNLGTCIYKTTISITTSEYSSEVFKGDCTMQGQVANGLLPVIHSMTLMETDQISPILYISTLTSNCVEILSISTYDGHVAFLASQDSLVYPLSLLTVCYLTPPILAASKGSRGVLFAAMNDEIYATQISGSGAFPDRVLKSDALIFQVGNTRPSSQGIQIVAMAIQHQVTSSATKDPKLHHIVIITQNGDLHSIPVGAFSLKFDQISTMIPSRYYTEGQGATAIMISSIVALVGRRVFYINAENNEVYQVMFSNVKGCVGGFTIPETDNSIQGMCVQGGRGLYTDFDHHRSLQVCPEGTFGLKAGASLQQIACQQCPDGTISPTTGKAFCSQCPPGSFSNPFHTECITSCPRGTYRPVSSKLSCEPCQAGYSTSSNSQTCLPCAEGTYSNALTSWQCLPCPLGFTSLKGAHNCVRICSDREDSCALDGEECISLTKQYKVLSQIFTSNTGQRMVGIAVDKIGGVFYTNGNNIRYYFDDCPSYLEVCKKEGQDLLPASQFMGYSFSSLAICNLVSPPPTSSTCGSSSRNTTYYYTRKLYVSSITYSSVYVLYVCQNGNGVVDIEATMGGSGLILLAGSKWSGFADGPFKTAIFNQPADLELNAKCSLLYLSDFFNHRIRSLNITSEMVTTVAGMGFPCWKMGSAVCATEIQQPCLTPESNCGSIHFPIGIGLSSDEKHLFIAANNINSVVKVGNVASSTGGGTLENTCKFSFGNKVYGTVQQCDLSALNSKGCMLYRPFDITTVSEHEMYVGVSQGITKIYSEDGGKTFLCQQVAGNFFDISTFGLVDGIKPSETTTSSSSTPNSLVNVPYKMAFAKDRGVIYFADLLNGAIRRVLVKTNCICPVGTVLLPHAASCYNPSPSWSKKSLPLCPPGLYALDGDLQCFRKCSDAIQQGLSAAPCLISPENKNQFNSLAYTQLLGDLNPPQSSLQADWYGSIPSASFNFVWNSIFQSTDLGPTIAYRQGRVPGRAPLGKKFVSLTYSLRRKCWYEEQSFTLQPVHILPGLWFPCQKPTTNSSSCTCPSNVNAFEPLPFTQAEKEAQSIAPKRWQALRTAAALSKALFMDPDPTKNCKTPEATALLGLPSPPGCTIQSASVFLILGSPDVSSRVACPETAAEGGPCFPTLLRHIQKEESPERTVAQTFSKLTNSKYSLELKAPSDLPQLSCYLGWPAHYYCPNGYLWVAPSSTTSTIKTCNPVSEQVTCLSCLPGTYSFMELKNKQKLGGPYACTQCHHGTFSSSVGASTCSACPVGKYASFIGATMCESCAPGMYTVFNQAYSRSQCTDCLPGTGNCTDCVEGTYQNDKGQIKCLITPAGFYTPLPNASEPTPCPPGFYQDTEGQTECMQCDVASSFTHGSGATACEQCAAINCSMALNNTCGKGCGFNQYWHSDTRQCTSCPSGTVNAYDECAMHAGICWQNPRTDYFISPLTNQITLCPHGSQANSLFNGCTPCENGFYSDGASQGCKQCQKGKYTNTSGSSKCWLCEPGKAMSEEGKSTCYDCAPGTFSTLREGSANCSFCPMGQFSDTYATVDCKLCPYGFYNTIPRMTECNESCDASQGYYSLPGDSACRYCEGGTINVSRLCQGCGLGQYIGNHSDDTDKRKCVSCPVGLVNLNITNAETVAACIPCASPTAYAAPTNIACIETNLGYVPNATGNGQIPCPKGTIRDASMTTCTQCPEGSYNAREGAEVCSECEPGKYTDIPGQALCFLCPTGTISKEPGAKACLPCPAGTFVANATYCNNCFPNTYNPLPKQAKCLNCDDNTYSSMGATECSYCPDGKVLNSKKECDLCPPGKYMLFDSIRSPQIGHDIYKCLNCNSGKYMPFPANHTRRCLECSAGLVALGTGASVCKPCPAGNYAMNNSATICYQCSRGTYGPDGLGGCIDCPVGTYGNAKGVSACLPCPQGYYQDSHGKTECKGCPVGSFSNTTGQTICTSCAVVPNTFNKFTAQSSCTAKLSSCEPGKYVQRSNSPFNDNGCANCLPCGPNQLAFVFKNSATFEYTNDEIQIYTSQVCPGNTEAPLYQCIDQTPRAGEYLSFDIGIGESSSSPTSSSPPFSFKQCVNPKYNDKRVLWVAGKDISHCYVSCLYGSSSIGLLDYVQKYNNFVGGGGEKEDPQNNVFLERLLDTHVDSVCLPCPLITLCPRGKFRPRGQLNPVCGPECGLPGVCSASAEDQTTGCIASCTNAPLNSDYVDGSQVLGSNACPWVCNPSWHLSDDKNACIPCPFIDEDMDEVAANQLITATCGSTDYALLPKDQCLQWHTNMDLCRQCPHVINGRSVGWDSAKGRCKYQCHSGYFLISPDDNPMYYAKYTSYGNESSTLLCIPCTTVWERNWTQCPDGMYLDQATCYMEHSAPICRDCISKPSVTFVSNGGLNASTCRGICPPGFHTVSQSSGHYYLSSSSSDLDVLPFVPDVQCVQCQPTDQRTCFRSNASICFEGSYKNLSVKADQIGSCVPCTTKDQCSSGGGYYFTKICTGEEVRDTPCIPCPESLLQDSSGVYITKQFISYKDIASLNGLAQLQVISRDYCPRVCLNNFARDPDHPKECISCKSMAYNLQKSQDPTKISLEDKKCIQSGSGISACSFMFSNWNATPALPWWDVKGSTPWMEPILKMVPPIIVNGAPLTQRAGRCWPCPDGMSTGPKDKDICTLIPGFISPSESTPVTIEAIPSLPADISAAVLQSPLIFNLNSFLRTKNNGPGIKTPLNRRRMLGITVDAANKTNASDALMIVQKPITGAKPCPFGYYKPSSGEGQCFSCPLGSSTRSTGSTSKDSCICKYGYYRTVAQTSLGGGKNLTFFCLPCPAETFNTVSLPVTSSFTTATSTSKDQCTPCPPNQTTYGNEGATRCVCALGMIMDSKTGKCIVCPAGHYCKPCDYSDLNETLASATNATGSCSSASSGGITQNICFSGSTSPTGSYAIDNCTCSIGMVKKSRPRNKNQFYCQNIPMGGEVNTLTGDIVCKKGWTVISKADDGSVSECALCQLGYYAMVNGNGAIVLTASRTPLCTQCPKDFYISSRYGIGIDSCFACPAMQTTPSPGAISLQDCVCPPSMAKDPKKGTCMGCSPTQFVDPLNASLCQNCPANAISSMGATSLAQCMCKAGFYSSMTSTSFFSSTKLLSCIPCPMGTYSSYASNTKTECTKCPAGSLTATIGSTRLSACGEKASLCERGYAWRAGVGCYKI